MTDIPLSPSRGPEQPTPSMRPTPSTGVPRWLSPAVLVLAVVVLASNVFYVIGLAASGVTSTDGQAAYGVRGGDVASFLPPGLSDVIAFVSLWAVLLGPLHLATLIVVAAWLAWRSWRRRSVVDACAIGALVAAGALIVLLAFWGDELMVWIWD
ncbi:hypothetical protein [Clavibacter zhangzhiyongii]|uniref:hypothetical protein n=1 Tax=Clavibacter zhangzhiyongii TaxID=2768071 RepID=UPI0039E17503